MATIDVKGREYWRGLAKQQSRVNKQYVRMKDAIEKALALLEPIEQAELRVFKARTFLRDSLKPSE
jgi:hypothetical protein